MDKRDRGVLPHGGDLGVETADVKYQSQDQTFRVYPSPSCIRQAVNPRRGVLHPPKLLDDFIRRKRMTFKTSPLASPVSRWGNSHSGLGFRGGDAAYAAEKWATMFSSATLQYTGGPSDRICLTQALGLAL